MDKRNHPRIDLKNFFVDASDGVGFFQGVVSDVSRFGVCVSDLPKRLDGSVKKMTIIVNGQGHNFKMNARPRWSSSDGASKSVGVEIPNPPCGWTEFVMGLEPKMEHEDAWASVSL